MSNQFKPISMSEIIEKENNREIEYDYDRDDQSPSIPYKLKNSKKISYSEGK